MPSSYLSTIEAHVRQQLDAEEAPGIDWLALADAAHGLVRRINEQDIEVSPIVYQFLDETMDRRDTAYGAFRRELLRAALAEGTAFPS
ncbi:MAG TPA: hypothetical protein VN018_01700 [Brevundimonas sp.]|nr:hypothetical protein [Brevundimonas sp.]